MTEAKSKELAQNVLVIQSMGALQVRLAKAVLLAQGELAARRAGVYRIVSPLEWRRAAGDTVCERCGLSYRDHYVDECEDKFELHRLCEGDLVKL